MSEKKVLPIEELKKISSAEPTQIPGVPGVATDQITPVQVDKWTAALNKTEPSVGTMPPPADTKASPIDGFRASSGKIEGLKQPTVDQLIAQANDLKTSLQKPIARLQGVVNANAPTSISPVYGAPLTERLVHIDSSLTQVLGKIGSKGAVPALAKVDPNQPLVKFLNYLTVSDAKLTNIATDAQLMENQKNISPQNLMAIQIKLGFVQQELEFFTNVLNKALESTKTVMNVQI